MKLNKNSSYTLLHLLGGQTTATKIAAQLDNVDVRSVQRALARLVELGLVQRKGARNNPAYSVIYKSLVIADIPDKLLEDDQRPETTFNHDFITYLRASSEDIFDPLFPQSGQAFKNSAPPSPAMTAKDLEYLTVELSWKSSALEGNTYTLLDTQLLLLEGVKAKNKTEFETQMILNHKNAIAFIVENKELFQTDIRFSTVEELHKIIGYNLGIGTGVRQRLIKITASNYTPLAYPRQLREYADDVLMIINRTADPILKSLLALALLPYLQTFEDGNKRTGRMLANAILIHSIGRGFSLRKVSARQLAMAYLTFYEFNSMLDLTKILGAELNR